MTKNSKHPRGWGLIEEVLSNSAFLEEISKIRTISPFARPGSIARLLNAFGIPARYFEFIHNYVENDTIDRELIREPVSVISNIDQTVEPANDPHEQWKLKESMGMSGVYLGLSHDITQPELIGFIKENWTSLIRPRLKRGRGRLGYSHYPERDKQIYESYKNRKELGINLAFIQSRYNVSRSQIYRIKRRHENGP